jgi:hypothetical protein
MTSSRLAVSSLTLILFASIMMILQRLRQLGQIRMVHESALRNQTLARTREQYAPFDGGPGSSSSSSSTKEDMRSLEKRLAEAQHELQSELLKETELAKTLSKMSAHDQKVSEELSLEVLKEHQLEVALREEKVKEHELERELERTESDLLREKLRGGHLAHNGTLIEAS